MRHSIIFYFQICLVNIFSIQSLRILPSTSSSQIRIAAITEEIIPSLTSKVDKEYGVDAITVLEGLEPVRKRPGM